MEVSIFKLPVVIRNIIDKFLIDLECSTIVTNELKNHNDLPYDSFLGYCVGLKGILQDKNYTANNVLAYEKVYRDNPTRAFESQFFPYCGLIMYYLQQENPGIQYPPKTKALRVKQKIQFP